MTLTAFIRENRAAIDRVILTEMNLGRRNPIQPSVLDDETREDWIANEESLYLWATAEGCFEGDVQEAA